MVFLGRLSVREGGRRLRGSPEAPNECKSILDEAYFAEITFRAGMQGQGEVIRHVFGDQRLPCGLDGVQFLKTFHDGLGDLTARLGLMLLSAAMTLPR